MSMLGKLEPGLDGLQQLRSLLASGKQPPIHETLDISLTLVEKGAVVVEARPGERHLNAAGIVQGGYIAAIMDTACGCAIHTLLPPNTGCSTIELKVAYHRPVTSRAGLITAEGRVLSSGRRVAFAEAKLFDSESRLLASATSSLITIPVEKTSAADLPNSI
jgi:uncharacterized protein (TIGR00369 family)